MTYSILVAVQVIVALALIGLILVQHGKGADAGAAFGSGASGTVFGAQGSANFLSHVTAGLATVFFLLSLALAYLVGGSAAPTGNSVTQQLQNGPPPVTQTMEGNQTRSSASTAGQAAGTQSAEAGKQEQSEGVTAKIPE